MQNNENRLCPVCNTEIEAETCYEIIMCLTAGFNPKSVPEVDFSNNQQTKEI